jgi:phosphate transport system substrate-binding protein
MIFNGTITEWDDKAIKNLNRDLNLPHEKIIVIHEDANGNSSSLDLLRKYAPRNVIKWPSNGSSMITTGSDDLASMVRKIPYSIGYVDFSYAIQTKMTFAAMANAHNDRYIIPSIDSISHTVNTAIQIQNISNASQTTSTTTLPPLINSSRLLNSSYPIVGLYYAALPSDKLSSNDRNATLDFVKWIIDRNKGQQALSEVQYPAIYDNRTLMIYTQSIIEKIMHADNNNTK